MFSKKCSQIVLGAALALPVFSAHASFITLDTSQSEFDAGVLNQGWWASNAMNNNANDNHVTGISGTTEYRSFYTFDFSGIKGKVKSASLQIRTGDQLGQVTLHFWDVTTAAATVNNNVGINQAIFDDLGSGKSYGSYIVQPVFVQSKYLTYTLDSRVFDDMNKTTGYFTIGATATSPEGYYIFGGSGSDVTSLLLEIDDGPAPSRVPEPASFAILLAGVGSMTLARRRK